MEIRASFAMKYVSSDWRTKRAFEDAESLLLIGSSRWMNFSEKT
jgi:hypothetical protein